MKKFKLVISEEELVNRLKSGEKSAFEALYNSYANNLYGIVMKVVRTDPPAQDVIQEAFIKIWKNVSAYNNSKGSIFTWMLNITRNTAIDKLRSAEYKSEIRNYDVQNYSDSVNINHHKEPSFEHIGVQEILLKLKSEHKEIIDLAYFEGYSQSEIAEKLNIPLGTVKTRVKLAMQHLREILKVEIN